MIKPNFKKIYIEITNRCNMDCSFCQKLTRNFCDMTVEQFDYVAVQVKNFTEHIYLHVKGEPLLHRHLPDIIKTAQNHNLKVNITTNGTLIASQTHSLLLFDNLRQINFSLHSMCNEKDTLFQKYIADIVQFIKTTRSHKICKPYISLRLWRMDKIDTQNQNFTFLIDTLQREFCELDFDLAFELAQLRLDTHSKKRGLTLSNRLFLNLDDEFIWPSLEGDFISDIGTCYASRDMVCLLANGDVTPCCLDGNGVMSIGNIFNSNLEQILTSPEFLAMQEGFKNNKLTMELCKHCSYHQRFS